MTKKIWSWKPSNHKTFALLQQCCTCSQSKHKKRKRKRLLTYYKTYGITTFKKTCGWRWCCNCQKNWGRGKWSNKNNSWKVTSIKR
jgi:hypothetical protein